MTSTKTTFCTRKPSVISTNGIWIVCEDPNYGRLRHPACGFSRYLGYRTNTAQIAAAEEDHRLGRHG
jgi:hypothetical protein